MTDIDIDALRDIVVKYAAPDPAIVTQVKKGRDWLDAVGHAEVTRILCQIDPGWTWEPQEWAPTGGPLILTETCDLPQTRESREKGEEPRHVDMVILWGFLTIFGKTLPCVGTTEAHKPEGHKELISDLLRNGAMRFGIALNLWSKAEMAGAEYEAEAREPEALPQDFHGWPSKADHDTWWKATSLRIKALEDYQRNVFVSQMQDKDLFGDDRRPLLPIHHDQQQSIERRLTNAAEMVEATLAGPSEHAVEVMAGALNCDDPVNAPPVEIEPFMWDLAEVEDLDAHDWKPTIKAFGLTEKALIAMAGNEHEAMGRPAPERLDDIHGEVARELRIALLQMAEPY